MSDEWVRALSCHWLSLSLEADTGSLFATTRSLWGKPELALLWYTEGGWASSMVGMASPYRAVPLWLLRKRWSKRRSARQYGSSRRCEPSKITETGGSVHCLESALRSHQ